VLGRIRDLANAMKAMTPDPDWSWLYRVARRLRRRVKSVRNKRARVVHSLELWQFGLGLMDEADGPSGWTPLERATSYRTGLMIALLAARPLRRRNFASIEIGHHLIKAGGRYSLRFDGTETKTGAPIDNLIPAALNPYLERYLSHYRPYLIGRAGRWKNRLPDLPAPGMHLWVSNYASAMSEGAIYEQICNLTRARFGHALNPHLFGDCAATSVATDDPACVHIMKTVLGHSSLKTSEKHYMHAQSHQAMHRHHRHVESLRRQSRDAQPLTQTDSEA
jgi:integrase/recombinase XerD